MSDVSAHISPEVSVIIVTYNVAPFISFCIDSVLRSSSSERLEIIIIDNASQDSTVQTIRQEYPDIYLNV